MITITYVQHRFDQNAQQRKICPFRVANIDCCQVMLSREVEDWKFLET